MSKTKRRTKFKLKEQPSEVCEEAVVNFMLSTERPGSMIRRVVFVKVGVFYEKYFSTGAKVIILPKRTSLNR